MDSKDQKDKSKKTLDDLDLKEKIKALEVLNEELTKENEKLKGDLEEFKSMNSKLLLKLTSEVEPNNDGSDDGDDDDDDDGDEELKAIRAKIEKHNEEIQKVKEENANGIKQ